jgi:transposase
MLTIGLDVHQRTSTCCILNTNGKAVKEKTIKGHWSKMLDYLSGLNEPVQVCFEASCGYGVIHDRLAQFAQRVVVAHPGRVRLIFKAKRKNDRIDAQKLAKLLYLDEVPTVHVPSMDGRAWRELIEMRRRQIDARVRVKNQIRALLRAYGIVPPPRMGLWTKKGRAWLAEQSWPTPTGALRRDVLLTQLDQSDEIAKTLTDQLDTISDKHPGVILLQTIPGVGPRTAETVVAYIDDAHRFARTNRVASYFGLVPRQDSSANVNRLGHITREGPGTARKMLVESAWRCIDRCEVMREASERIAGGKKDRKKIAVIAIARRLSRIMLAMLKTGETWNVESLRRPLKAAA